MGERNRRDFIRRSLQAPLGPRAMGVERWISSSWGRANQGPTPAAPRQTVAYGCMKKTPFLQLEHLLQTLERPSLSEDPHQPPCGGRQKPERGSLSTASGPGGDGRAPTALPVTRVSGSGGQGSSQVDRPSRYSTTVCLLPAIK